MIVSHDQTNPQSSVQSDGLGCNSTKSCMVIPVNDLHCTLCMYVWGWGGCVFQSSYKLGFCYLGRPQVVKLKSSYKQTSVKDVIGFLNMLRRSKVRYQGSSEVS